MTLKNNDLILIMMGKEMEDVTERFQSSHVIFHNKVTAMTLRIIIFYSLASCCFFMSGTVFSIERMSHNKFP